MLRSLILVVLFLAGAVAAQTVDVPPTAGFDFLGLLKGWLTPASIGSVLVAIGSVVGGLLLKTEVRKRRVAKAVYYAFHIAEDIGNEHEGEDVFDKGAAALKALNAYMLAKGWRAAKPGEVEVAKLEFSALHGEQVEKVKLVEAAAIAQANAATVVAQAGPTVVAQTNTATVVPPKS